MVLKKQNIMFQNMKYYRNMIHTVKNYNKKILLSKLLICYKYNNNFSQLYNKK